MIIKLNLRLFTEFLIFSFFKKESEVTQLCPTLCNPMDCSLPGSSVHGIFQARILEWVAISFFRASSQPRDQTQSPTLWADALPSETQGKPISKVVIYYYSYLKLCSLFHIVYTLILFFYCS